LLHAQALELERIPLQPHPRLGVETHPQQGGFPLLLLPLDPPHRPQPKPSLYSLRALELAPLVLEPLALCALDRRARRLLGRPLGADPLVLELHDLREIEHHR
jgi:hypothetical protein